MAEGFSHKRSRPESSSEVCKLGISLAVIKIVKCIGIFESYDLLKTVSILQLIYFIKLSSSFLFIFMKRSLLTGLKLKRSLNLRIGQYCCLGLLIDFLYLFGLTLCGPLRTILVFEHSAPIVVAMINGIFSKSNYARTRGSILFFLGVITLLLFDTDVFSQVNSFPGLKDTNFLFNFLYLTSTAFGVADHKSGILLLVFLLILKVIQHSFAKRISSQIGGSNKLHIYSNLFSTLILTPVYFISVYNGYQKTSVFTNFWTLFLITLFAFVVDHSIQSYVSGKIEGLYSYKIGYISIALFALLLGFQWNHPAAVAISAANTSRTQDHIISGGVIISAVFFILSSDILSWSGHKSRKGNFVGYSSEGLPLYSFAENVLNRASTFSVVSTLQRFLKQIFERNDSRHIFYFLCLNLSFAFVELFWGLYTNSLGLVSDSFHMMFDSTSLVLGLIASVMSRWKPNRSYPYGFGRVEVLSGFVNSLFLFVIAIFLIYEAASRLMNPPEINSDKLLTVSVTGLIVNMIGAYLLGHHHHHGHGHSDNHSHCHKRENINIKGVYLHVLTDLLGSVGVIISAILVKKYQLYIADPICTVLIAIFILYSLMPLLLKSSSILTLSLLPKDERNAKNALYKISHLEGVVSLHSCSIWEHGNGDFIASLCLTVQPYVTEQRVITQATNLFREHGINSCTIQVEKDDFYQHLSGLVTGSEEFQPPNSVITNPNLEFTKLI